MAYVKFQTVRILFLVGYIVPLTAMEEEKTLIPKSDIESTIVPLIITPEILRSRLEKAFKVHDGKQMQECYNAISKDIIAQQGIPESFYFNYQIKYHYYDYIQKYIPEEILEYCQKDCRRALKKELKNVIVLNRSNIGRKNTIISALQICGGVCWATVTGVGMVSTIVLILNGVC